MGTLSRYSTRAATRSRATSHAQASAPSAASCRFCLVQSFCAPQAAGEARGQYQAHRRASMRHAPRRAARQSKASDDVYPVAIFDSWETGRGIVNQALRAEQLCRRASPAGLPPLFAPPLFAPRLCSPHAHGLSCLASGAHKLAYGQGHRHVSWGCAEQVIECFHGVQERTPSELVLVSPSQSPSTAVGAAQTFPDAPAAPSVAPPSPSA